MASSSVDGSVVLWDINTGEKTDVLFQPGGEAIRNCQFSPNSEFIVSTDDSGVICVFGQDKILKKSIKGAHEESTLTLAFSKDSKILLTACTLGNIRMFDMRNLEKDDVQPDLHVDSAHDLGCNGADFCRYTKTDRKSQLISHFGKIHIEFFFSIGWQYDNLYTRHLWK